MPTRRPLIAGNWKMYKTTPEAVACATEIRDGSKGTDVEMVVAPPFTALCAVAAVLKGSAVGLGAQDMYWEAEGAYTGAVSPLMLTDAGCSHVILGHSERRQLFGETDDAVAKKAEAAFKYGLTPIV